MPGKTRVSKKSMRLRKSVSTSTVTRLTQAAAHRTLPDSRASHKPVSISDTRELRTWLARNMLDVANGQQPPAIANAVCGYAQQIYNTMNIELKHASAAKRLGVKGAPPVKIGG